MRFTLAATTLLALLLCVQLATHTTHAQSRRLRIRARPTPVPAARALAVDPDEDSLEDESGELSDDYQQPQYYQTTVRAPAPTPTSRYVSSNDDYNGLYGQPTQPTPRARIDTYQPRQSLASGPAPKSKENQTKAPPVQTIRNYNKVNDDGSFTFGYEAADGSFKEETRGTDCVVRGKYGYVDPDGNKREFTYVSGNPCDPSHPDETADDDRRQPQSAEDLNEPENVPQNFPRRPIAKRPPPPPQQQQFARPATTAAPPTTVFQNTYASNGYASQQQQQQLEEDEDEQPETIQLLQQRPRQQQQVQYQRPEEVTIRQRPRITVTATTPSPLAAFLTPTRPVQPVSITPRPTYRLPQQSLQTQPPATTYRPSVQFITQKSPSLQQQQQRAQQQYTVKPTIASSLAVEPLTKSAYVSSRKPIDFAVEFQKFQQEHNVLQPTPTPTARPLQLQTHPTQRPFKPSPIHNIEQAPTSNPIYESQLVFDPSTGQYDSNLFQQLPQSEGDFSLSNRHQPYVQLPSLPQPQFNRPPAHLVSLEQLRQQPQSQLSAQPIYNRQPLQTQATRSPLQFQPQPQPQFSQQVYQKEHENNQVFSSQQLFAQQQELQQAQLQQDRLIAASKRQPQLPAISHRFQQQQQQQQQQLGQFQQQPQGFYYVQPPQQATGQIDAFLRGHNIDF